MNSVVLHVLMEMIKLPFLVKMSSFFSFENGQVFCLFVKLWNFSFGYF